MFSAPVMPGIMNLIALGTSSGGYDDAMLEVFSMFFAMFVVSLAIAAIISYILQGIAFMKIFAKVGIAPWHAWVPFLNLYDFYSLAFPSGWYFLFLLVPIAETVFPIICEYRVSKYFGKSTGFAVLSIFFGPITRLIIGFGSAEYNPPADKSLF